MPQWSETVRNHPFRLLSETVITLTEIAKVQSLDRNAYFLFIGDVNAHHEEWLGPSTTNLHGRVARGFAS